MVFDNLFGWFRFFHFLSQRGIFFGRRRPSCSSRFKRLGLGGSENLSHQTLGHPQSARIEQTIFLGISKTAEIFWRLHDCFEEIPKLSCYICFLLFFCLRGLSDTVFIGSIFGI